MRLSDFTNEIKGQARGLAFTRLALALAAGSSPTGAAAVARSRYSETSPVVEMILRSAVAAGTTTDPTWAGNLVGYRSMAREFVELARPLSLLGRLNGWRRVPFYTPMLATAGSASAGWVGQARPIPVSAHAFGRFTLADAKLAALVVLTDEVARSAKPAAEMAVRDELLAAASLFADRGLIDPNFSAVAGVSPASLTHGVTPIASTGSSVAAIQADLSATANQLIAAGSDLRSVSWVLNPRTALFLSMLRDAGGRVFPDVTATGGTLIGIPVLTSSAVPVEGSPATTHIVLIDPRRVLLADDDLAVVDFTRDATLQMVDNPATGAAQMISLFQGNLVGFRVTRFINWQACDTGACALVSGVSY